MTMTVAEAQLLMEMALGRLFRIGSRPFQDGDDAEYEKCRAAAMEAYEVLRPEYAKGSRRFPGPAPLPGWNFGSGTSGAIE